ncbi:hypothetical protein ACOMHN_026035 [Nucella lapillus]
MKSTVFAILAVCWLTALVKGQSDIRCPLLKGGLTACYKDQGLTIKLHDSDLADKAIDHFDAVLDVNNNTCNKLDAYKNAIACAVPLIKTCASLVGLRGAIASAENIQRSFDYLCNRTNDYDSTCADKVAPLIEDCLEWTMRKEVKEKGQTSDTNKAICWSADVLYDCSKHYFQEKCNAITKDIALELVNTFLLPEPCTNNPPGRAGREPYQLVLSSASTSALSLGVLVVCLLLLSFLNH